ncbi:MAG TPA: tetratricopeptide repeat protein [Streptosporangiaceae bacterium]|nr:tetratricopeptide repeat protein [Streptosporangiaceae bacterium]
MPLLTRDEFDAIEFEAALTGDHLAAAERMSELAATGTQSESMARAEAFVRAGEQWLLADNAELAAYDFRMAIADGGPVDVDPRVSLCRALFQLGHRDEAYALIGELRSEGRADARACDMITELLVEQSDLPAALDWATTGVELLVGAASAEAGASAEASRPEAAWAGSADSGLRDLLRLRYRIRNDLRLPEDDYDRMLGS